jgi:hypothetical protein
MRRPFALLAVANLCAHPPQQKLAREILKQLVEINTPDSVIPSGSVIAVVRTLV